MTIRRNVGQVTKGVAVGQRSAGRIIGKTCEHVPTGAVLVVQTERRSEIVVAGFALVGAIAIFTQQEKPWPTTSFVSARRFCAVPLRSSACEKPRTSHRLSHAVA